MKVLKNLQEWMNWRNGIDASLSIGFVPTMGNLHHGHASLLEKARGENDIVILSIYINPTQFNNAADFKQYPKTLDEDLALAKTLNVDAVFLPDDNMMYADHYRFSIQESIESKRLEGASRPGHFQGMLTIVIKLLMLTRADCAYFGEKDYQQYFLIREMCDAFFIPTTIKSCETVRMASGLPLSSRNSRLSKDQLLRANHYAEIIRKDKIISDLKIELEKSGIAVDYIEDIDGRRFSAVFIDDIRLIDNFKLNFRGSA